MSTRTFHCLACHCHLIDPRTPAYLTPCCNRWVCDACVSRNPRLLQYCLYCQDPRRWIGEDLELPPYEGGEEVKEELPAYEELRSGEKTKGMGKMEGKEKGGFGTMHYVRPRDTLVGLALKYGVDITDLRRTNRLYHDNDLHARQVLQIPSYDGPSYSSSPSPDEERNTLLKRFQLRSKCADTAEARFYMDAAGYDLDGALERYRDDLTWEREHPRITRSVKEGVAKVRR